MDKQTQQDQVLMARQPIFDTALKVVAYELLYRTERSPEYAHIEISGSTATSQVILNIYSSINDGNDSRQLPAFINLTEELLLSGVIPDLPRDRVVLEILEDVKATPGVIRAVQTLRRDGYRIALDDFIHSPEYAPLIKLAHIVKVDVLEMSVEEIQAQVDKLRPYGVTLLAEKIETHAMLEACIEMGFTLFQGYFLSKPKLVTGRKLEGNQIALMQLMRELQSPDTTPARLEDLIVKDPVLTYRLLRIVNSAQFNLVRQVTSIAQAIVLMGLTEVRKWATLIAMTTGSDKPEELSRQLLLRGRMCEQLTLAHVNDGAGFMVGMLSGLDALLDIDKHTLMKQVPLDDAIKAAVSTGEGELGATLSAVLMYERGDWDQLPEGLDVQLYDEAYRDSLSWTDAAIQSMNG